MPKYLAIAVVTFVGLSLAVRQPASSPSKPPELPRADRKRSTGVLPPSSPTGPVRIDEAPRTAPSPVNRWHKSYKDALETADQQHKDLLVVVGTEGCLPCLRLKKVLTTTPVEYVLYYCNDTDKPLTDGPPARDLFQLSRLTTYPILVLVTGKQISHHDPKELFPWWDSDQS